MRLGSHIAVATSPIRPLAWEPPYVVGVALEKAKNQKKKKDFSNKNKLSMDMIICSCFI